jgi:hypothetical protein
MPATRRAKRGRGQKGSARLRRLAVPPRKRHIMGLRALTPGVEIQAPMYCVGAVRPHFTVDLPALSGGADDGAFGAGRLVGWVE